MKKSYEEMRRISLFSKTRKINVNFFFEENFFLIIFFKGER